MFITFADATGMSAQPVQKVGIEDMFIWGSFRNDIGLGLLGKQSSGELQEGSLYTNILVKLQDNLLSQYVH